MESRLVSNGDLRSAYIRLGSNIEPDTFVTLVTNQNWSQEKLRQMLKSFCARMDRGLLGSTWSEKPPAERTDGLFFIEHTDSNIHAHGLLRTPHGGEKCFASLAEHHWGKLCEGGSVDVQALENPERCAAYCTKEMTRFCFRDDQIVFTREFMNRYAD